MPDITLRQIEVIRAVMLRGTISGAAEFLNVSAPGISRLIKHTEESLGVRLFERRAGLVVPSVEASKVFDQIREVYRGVETLQSSIGSLKKGAGASALTVYAVRKTGRVLSGFAEFSSSAASWRAPSGRWSRRVANDVTSG